jgi:flagellar assembly factor FliW
MLKTLPALELEFPVGLPGLERASRFRLEPLGKDLNVFGQLKSTVPVKVTGQDDAREITIIVAAPGLLWPEYAVEVDDESLEVLQLEQPEDAAVLVIVHVGADLAHSTANLFAPIVVNIGRQLATQVVPKKSQSEVPWGIQAPLPAIVFS